MNQQPRISDLRVQTCTKTVMDTTDPDITFDESGVCNHWHEFHAFKATLPNDEQRDRRLAEVVARIKSAGRGKAHDCILGLSGGVDSSYLAWLAKQLGLRPLIVHFDNGWNSELAVGNIEQLVSRLGYNLETFVMDWEEFRDVQRAYFKASVIDLEVPTDHFILGALYRTAAKYGIKYRAFWPELCHRMAASEGLVLYKTGSGESPSHSPHLWGEESLRKLPTFGVWQQAYYHARGFRSVALLDLADYHKAEAKDLLVKKLGWRDYGGKHYKFVFTRFYQSYILPQKFGVDKRKAHLSNLILMGEMTREEALRELQQPTYDNDLQQLDKEYVAKKLGFSLDEFEEVLSQPNRAHQEFETDRDQRKLYFKIIRTLSPIRQYRKNSTMVSA